MIRSRLRPLVLVLAAACPPVVAGCGGGDKAQRPVRTPQTERVPGGHEESATDRTGDVRVLAYPERPPGRDALDLTRVTLRRAGGRLSVSFRTAKPAEPPMVETLQILSADGLEKAYVEIQRLGEGGIHARYRPPDRHSRSAKVRRSGNELTADVPVGELTRSGKFKWRAWVSTKGTVVDRLPDDQYGMRFFPRRARSS